MGRQAAAQQQAAKIPKIAILRKEEENYQKLCSFLKK